MVAFEAIAVPLLSNLDENGRKDPEIAVTSRLPGKESLAWEGYHSVQRFPSRTKSKSPRHALGAIDQMLPAPA
jgi:hypothetical protein